MYLQYPHVDCRALLDCLDALRSKFAKWTPSFSKTLEHLLKDTGYLERRMVRSYSFDPYHKIFHQSHPVRLITAHMLQLYMIFLASRVAYH